MYSHTVAQARQQTVLVRATAEPAFDVGGWSRLCRPQASVGAAPKSELLLLRGRAELAARVRKRPASVQATRPFVKELKRTPFTLERVGAPYKRPCSRL
jgi:hypothetical protein